MENEEFNYQILARYMDGDCTEQERREIEQWASANPENSEKLEEFQRIWDISEQKQNMLDQFFDTDEQWDELQQRLKKEGEIPAQQSSSVGSRRRSASIHSMTHKIVRVAAIFLIAGLLAVFAYQNWYQPEPEQKEPALREVSTANAQRVNLTLADGSSVMLNAGSTMKFPNQFSDDVREVFLKGEAYFNVERNAQKPFLIHSRGAVIRVLGTSFTVRSYPENEQVRVVVQEGKVSFEAANKDQSADSITRTMLTANEMGRYLIGSNEIETSEVDDMQLYLSWRKGYLKFREEPMQNVAAELERRYGVEVKFDDASISQRSLTAFLKSRSIKNVLDVISMSLDIEYQLKENTVGFYQK